MAWSTCEQESLRTNRYGCKTNIAYINNFTIIQYLQHIYNIYIIFLLLINKFTQVFRYFLFAHIDILWYPPQKISIPGLGCHHSELRRGAGWWLMVQKSGECIYTCSLYLLYLPGTYISTFCICRSGFYTCIYVYLHKDVKECFSANFMEDSPWQLDSSIFEFLVWEPSSSRLYQHTHICAISDGLQAGISRPIERSCCAVCDIYI